MKKSYITTFLTLPLVALMVTCANSEPAPAPLMPDYSSYGRINLAVGSLNVVDRSPAVVLAGVDGNLSPTLSDVAKKWVRDRLGATGGNGQAVVVIKDASLTATPLTTQGKMFTREQAMKYSAHLAVDIEADNVGNSAIASAEAHREVTLPENPSMAERQTAYNQLLEGLMRDFNRSFDQSIHDHLGVFLMTAPMMPGVAPSSNMPVPPANNPAPAATLSGPNP